MLPEVVHNKLDILLVSEKKIDPFFPQANLKERVLVFHFDWTEIV